MESRRLYVTRLAPFVNKKHLLKVFHQFGPTHAVVRRQSSGNTAFVTFATVEDASRALTWSSENPIMLQKRKLCVMAADSWHDHKLSEPSTSASAGPTVDPFPGWKPRYAPSIPEECIVHIAHCLPFRDRARMEQVCRGWRAGVFRSMQALKHLDLNDWRWSSGWDRPPVTKEALYWVLSRCGCRLVSVQLGDAEAAKMFPPQIATILVKMCDSLEGLDVTGIKIRTPFLRELANSPAPLENLALGECLELTGTDLMWMFKAKPGLRRLTMKGTKIYGISPCAFADLPKELVELKLENTEINADLLATAIAKLTSLKYLKIYNTTDFNYKILQALKDNSGLGESMETMNFMLCNPREEPNLEEEDNVAGNVAVANFLEFDLGPMAEAMSLPLRFTNVVDLSVAYCGWVDVTFIDNVGQYMSLLTRLDISGCTNVRGLFSLDSLGNLKNLSLLEMNHMFIDVGAQVLMELKSLKMLSCRDNEGVTHEDICGLIRHNTVIERIDVEGCLRVGRPLIDCVLTALRGDPHRHNLELFVGGTSAVAHRRDRRLMHVHIHYYRTTLSPYE